MSQKVIGLIGLFLAMCMIGCGGSEYRFGNARTLPNLSGQWKIIATSQTMAQQFLGTANLAQTNLGMQGTVSQLFVYCAGSATASAELVPNSAINPSSVVSYGVTMTLQEGVSSASGPQQINLVGTASADGQKMSGTYSAPAGSCTAGDMGVWTANKQ